MTNEEAIKEIGYVRYATCCDCSYFCDFEREPCKSCRYHESLTAAIEAIEKQIPKKPAVNNCQIVCPKCGELAFSIKTYGFCIYCGQALDWRDEE